MHGVWGPIRPGHVGQIVCKVEDVGRAEHIEALHIFKGDDDHGTVTHSPIVHPRAAGVNVYSLTIPANLADVATLAENVNGWPWRPVGRPAHDRPMQQLLDQTNTLTHRPSPPRSRITIYIAAVLGLGWLGPLVDYAAGNGVGQGPGQLVWILLPVVTATLLRWKGGDGFADAGLRPRHAANRPWYLLSSSFYPIVMVGAAASGVLVGDWDTHDSAAPLRLAAIALVALVPFTLTAIAEEFGWRGYLTPRLDAAGIGRLANHIVVGVVWGLWHLPYLALHWDFTDETMWTLAPRVVLGTTVAAIVYGEIRLRTGTVWPAVIMHACSNAIAAGLLDTDVLVQRDPTPWIFSPGIDGLAVISLTGLAAFLIFGNRSGDSNSRSPQLSRKVA